jgi:putative glycosyltransferase
MNEPIGPTTPATTAALMPEISVVSTVFRSRPFLEAFLAECREALAANGFARYEIVLVNDGSPDDALEYLLGRRADMDELVVVDLSRNFGHHPAMQAGLRESRGALVFLIDCDMEVRPAVLTSFLARLRASEADVVFGYQEARKGGWFERVSGRLFWAGFNRLSDIQVPESLLTERLMTRRYVDALLSLGDYNLFMGGMMSWAGFCQIGVAVGKQQREGRSSYTLLRRLRLMVNAISSFSSKPLVWLFNVGIVITLTSFGYAAYLIVRKLLFDDTLLGFTSMMAMLAMTLGVLTTGLGLIGVYVGKVFNQVQNRPTYIVRDIHRRRDR